ncbi:MAG TPA: hypothetical protein VKI45_05610 [Allosphingosinicella sp.]|nr:hypothetical protein [Allosphingosinicella sp.]
MNTNDSHIGRRSLIAGAAAAAGLSALATPGRAAKLATTPQRDRGLATGGAEDWQAAVGTVFAADTGEGRVPLRLVSVERFASGPARPQALARDHGFTLTFETLAGAMPSGARPYRLSSRSFQPVHVFFSSGEKQPTAIFN